MGQYRPNAGRSGRVGLVLRRVPEIFCTSMLDVQGISRYNNGTGITPTLFDLITSLRKILMQDHPSWSTLPSNTHDSETWKAYWKEQGQLWRTEPTIDEELQQRLLSYYQGVVDIERGTYPFKGVRLSRADVEWLLAMEEQRGAELSPRDGKGGNQHKSFGLDVRGVDLSQVNLSDLPLMRLHAGLSLEEGRHATVEQSRAAAANLAKADLSNAQLQGAQLSWVTLDEAVLVEAHLEGADLARRRLDHLAGQPAPPAYPSPARPEAALATSDQTDAWRSPVPARSVGAPAYAVL